MMSLQKKIGTNRTLFHLLFCACVLVLLFTGIYLLQAAGFRFSNPVSAITDCFFFLFCLYTGRWLSQSWYLKDKITPFILYSTITVFVLALLKYSLVRYVFDHPYVGFFELSRDILPFFGVALVSGMLLKIIRHHQRKALQEAQIQAEQRAAEFDVLQAQLSPHFLFNVLNNLYGISIEQHERIPQLLLKLSSLLRYSVYSGKKTFVPLKEELEYIRSYIEFEQIRVSDRLVLKTDIEAIDNPGVTIAPLVLIVFIENAFKHAKNTMAQTINVAVSLKMVDDCIHFSVVNSYAGAEDKDHSLGESAGLGLANTIKRLRLLYGNEYHLQQFVNKDKYHVILTIKNTKDIP